MVKDNGSCPSMGMLSPSWPAPPCVCAASTTRASGHSTGPFQSFNLGAHVGDDPEAVVRNRTHLRQALALPSEPLWLRQVHGCRVVDGDNFVPADPADAVVAREAGIVCAVLTADCLPVLFCDRQSTRVAAAHAGWRGLAAGVLEATVSALKTDPHQVLAWIGPGIGRERFEVGDEVRDVFVRADSGAASLFRPSSAGRWLADLSALARRRLQSAGIEAVYGGSWCTFSEPEHFFSYRREARTGRMASLIWIR